jgi:PAP2 superfamily
VARVIRLMAAGSEASSVGALRATPTRGRGEELGRGRGLALTLLVAAWLIWLFDAVNNLAPVRQGLAEQNGERVLDLERSLHLAPEHALNSWLAAHATSSRIVVFWYANVHIAVILAVLIALWWLRPDLLRVMLATLVTVTLIALAVFWSFPTAPARMLPGGYVDLVSAVHHLPVWRLGSTALHSNQLCSLPSLHIAFATWCTIALWRMSARRWIRAAAVVYPLLTSFAVMATANHYLADVLTGAGLTLLVYLLFERRLGPRKRDQPPPGVQLTGRMPFQPRATYGSAARRGS